MEYHGYGNIYSMPTSTTGGYILGNTSVGMIRLGDTMYNINLLGPIYNYSRLFAANCLVSMDAGNIITKPGENGGGGVYFSSMYHGLQRLTGSNELDLFTTFGDLSIRTVSDGNINHYVQSISSSTLVQMSGGNIIVKPTLNSGGYYIGSARYGIERTPSTNNMNLFSDNGDIFVRSTNGNIFCYSSYPNANSSFVFYQGNMTLRPGSTGGDVGAGYFIGSSAHGLRRPSGTNDIMLYTTGGETSLRSSGTANVRVTAGPDAYIDSRLLINGINSDSTFEVRNQSYALNSTPTNTTGAALAIRNDPSQSYIVNRIYNANLIIAMNDSPSDKSNSITISSNMTYSGNNKIAFFKTPDFQNAPMIDIKGGVRLGPDTSTQNGSVQYSTSEQFKFRENGFTRNISTRYATVLANGKIDTAYANLGIPQASHPATGFYRFTFNPPFSTKPIVFTQYVGSDTSAAIYQAYWLEPGLYANLDIASFQVGTLASMDSTFSVFIQEP